MLGGPLTNVVWAYTRLMIASWCPGKCQERCWSKQLQCWTQQCRKTANWASVNWMLPFLWCLTPPLWWHCQHTLQQQQPFSNRTSYTTVAQSATPNLKDCSMFPLSLRQQRLSGLLRHVPHSSTPSPCYNMTTHNKFKNPKMTEHTRSPGYDSVSHIHSQQKPPKLFVPGHSYHALQMGKSPFLHAFTTSTHCPNNDIRFMMFAVIGWCQMDGSILKGNIKDHGNCSIKGDSNIKGHGKRWRWH